MNIKDRRGIFTISKGLIDSNPEGVMKIMSNVIVIGCDYSADYGLYQYHAISPMFEELEMGRFPPEYGFMFSDEDRLICFTSGNQGSK